MRITKAGEYAIRCILSLSIKGKGRLVSRLEIVKAMEIPDQFLGKIAQKLARSGFIEIVQRAKGGYRLLLTPERIALLDVVEAVTGEIFLNDCIMSPDLCFRSSTCLIHRIWEKARAQLRDTLRTATFDKLINEETCFDLFDSLEIGGLVSGARCLQN